MSGTPLISVIVPVYKVEAYLDRCVQSIVDQTYTNLEIILVDDGSPDRCPQMCDEWEKRDSRIRVIHKENGGLSDARNAGMSVAGGEYISFVDSDDWIEPAFVQVLLNALLEHDCDVAGCGYWVCANARKHTAIEIQHTIKIFDRIASMQELLSNRDYRVVVWNKLYRRELIKSIQFEKGKYHEDEFWSFQVVGRLNRYALSDYVGYNYFQRADSIMGEGYSLKRLDALEAKVCRMKYLEANIPELANNERVMLHFSAMNHVQAAMRHLEMNECKTAIEYGRRVIREYPIGLTLWRKQKLAWRIWLAGEKVSFTLICRIRNLLRIGL